MKNAAVSLESALFPPFGTPAFSTETTKILRKQTGVWQALTLPLFQAGALLLTPDDSPAAYIVFLTFPEEDPEVNLHIG